MNRILFLAGFLVLLIAGGCSDQGKAPTSSDNDTIPSITISDASGNEGSSVVFTVSLNGGHSENVIFSYFTQPGSTSENDFLAISGIDTIPVGSTSIPITVTTVDDNDVESNETFSLTLKESTLPFLNKDSVGIGTIIDNDVVPTGVSFAADVQPVIQGSCAITGCHGSGSSQSGLSFGSGTYSQIRNASGNHGALIIVNNASSSNLYTKLLSTPPFGERMPLGGPYLSTTEINKIRDWINQGAQDN